MVDCVCFEAMYATYIYTYDYNLVDVKFTTQSRFFYDFMQWKAMNKNWSKQCKLNEYSMHIDKLIICIHVNIK